MVVVLVLATLAPDRATLTFRVDASGFTRSRRVPRVVLSLAGVRRLDWASVVDPDVVEGEVPGVAGTRVRDVATSLFPEVSVRVLRSGGMPGRRLGFVGCGDL